MKWLLSAGNCAFVRMVCGAFQNVEHDCRYSKCSKVRMSYQAGLDLPGVFHERDMIAGVIPAPCDFS